MATVKHPNLVAFHGVCLDRPPVAVVMELCPGSSLDKHLESFQGKISTGERLKYSVEAAEGLNCLHQR